MSNADIIKIFNLVLNKNLSSIFSFGPFSKIYFTYAATTGKVGEFLASILKSIKQNNNRIFIHGIGHSLGAHIMGNIFNFGGLKLDRISELDPAGPCFEGKLGDIRLPDKGIRGETSFIL